MRRTGRMPLGMRRATLMNSERRAFLCFALCFLGGIVPGCGYHLGEAGAPAGLSLGSLAIPLVESTASEPGFEAVFTRALREEFISYSKLPLVSENEARVILHSRVRAIRTESSSTQYTQPLSGNLSGVYEITRLRWLRLRLDARLVERETGKELWAVNDLEDRESFLVEQDPLQTRYQQERALERIAQRMAERLYAYAVERF
jgi:hypothetical protein